MTTYSAANIRSMTRKERRQRKLALELRNKNALLALIVPVMIAAKIMVAYVLPPKYFYDNNRMLAMVLGTAGDTAWGGSYEVAAALFRTLNVVDIETMVDWSICLGIIFTALVTLMILRVDAPDLLQSLFILATVGLLNIYIFTIGKDIIQFAFFFIVYIVLLIPIDNALIKILASAGILYYESTFFREYYVLIAALIIAVYVILEFFRSRQQLGVGSILAIIVLLFVTIYVMMMVAQRIMPSEYDQVIGLRAGYEDAFGDDNGGNMATAIQNWIPGDNLPIFMVNYIINAFRMMIPIELAMRGAYYLPFFVFQCMVTVYMVNLLRQINQINDTTLFLTLCVFLGYILASFIFEPDFGSWTRHEAATFPVLHLLVLNQYQKMPVSKEEWLLTKGLVS